MAFFQHQDLVENGRFLMKNEVNNGFLSYPKLSSATSIQSMEPLILLMHGFLVFEVESTPERGKPLAQADLKTRQERIELWN